MSIQSRVERLEGATAGTPTGIVILYTGECFAADARYLVDDEPMDGGELAEWLAVNQPEHVVYLPDNGRSNVNPDDAPPAPADWERHEIPPGVA